MAKAGAAQRETAVIPGTNRAPIARGSCLLIQPGVSKATLFHPLSLLLVLWESPQNHCWPHIPVRALGPSSHQGGCGGEEKGSHPPPSSSRWLSSLSRGGSG